jgi:hypothetical protein
MAIKGTACFTRAVLYERKMFTNLTTGQRRRLRKLPGRNGANVRLKEVQKLTLKK